MAINITSAYSGEALEQMLVRATTGNELVASGRINVVPDIVKDYFLPRLRTGKMLQKRKEEPTKDDSKGNFDIDERKLSPKEFMAFTVFNPRAFEYIWRKHQPKGDLLFAELSDEVQTQLLVEMAKVVDFEIGGHIFNGEYAEVGDDKLFDGIITRIKTDATTIKIATPVAITQSNVIATLGKIYKAIPKAIRKHKSTCMMMSVEDFDKYDDALSELPNKGTAYTDTNVKRFKGITIETYADMPEHVIVATIASNDIDSNLYFGVGSLADSVEVKVGRLTNAGELYFFKMLMKADTQIAYGEDLVFYDGRTAA